LPSAVLGSSRIQNAHHGLNQPGSGCAAASYIPVLMLSNRRWKRTLPRPHQRCEAAFKCTTHTRTTWWDRACRGDRSGVGQAAPRCGAQRILIPTNVNHTRSVTRQTNLETVRSLARNPLAWWTILRARGGHPTLLPARQTRSSSSWHEGGIGGCTTTHGATPAARPRFSAKLRRPVGPARPCGARSEWDRRPAGEAHNDEALTWPRVRRAGLPLCRTAALPPVGAARARRRPTARACGRSVARACGAYRLGCRPPGYCGIATGWGRLLCRLWAPPSLCGSEGRRLSASVVAVRTRRGGEGGYTGRSRGAPAHRRVRACIGDGQRRCAAATSCDAICVLWSWPEVVWRTFWRRRRRPQDALYACAVGTERGALTRVLRQELFRE